MNTYSLAPRINMVGMEWMQADHADPTTLTAWILAGSSVTQYGIFLAVILLICFVCSKWPHMPKHHQLDYRARLIGFASYSDYLSSPHWSRVKRWIHKRDGDKCTVCNGKNSLLVHHREYKNIGKERGSELTLVCKACHTEIHVIANHGVRLWVADKVYRRHYKWEKFRKRFALFH